MEFKFAKIIDGKLTFNAAEQYTFTNMEELLTSNKRIREVTGYKPVEYADKPEFDAETQYLADDYTETKNKINVNYIIMESLS